MKCSHCNSENQTGKFCTKCGQPLENFKFCTKCGSKIKMTEKFCTKCGAPNVFFSETVIQPVHDTQTFSPADPDVDSPSEGQTTIEEYKDTFVTTTVIKNSHPSVTETQKQSVVKVDETQDQELKSPILENSEADINSEPIEYYEEPQKKKLTWLWFLLALIIVVIGIFCYIKFSNKQTIHKEEIAIYSDTVITTETQEKPEFPDSLPTKFNYYGTIGEYQICLFLSGDNPKISSYCDGWQMNVTGYYTYLSTGNILDLKGTVCYSKNIISLEEYTKSGKHSATWTLHSDDNYQTLSGTFINLSNGKEYKVNLYPDDIEYEDMDISEKEILPLNFNIGKNFLKGDMIHTNGKRYPFTLSFDTSGNIHDIVYKNIGSGTTLKLICDYYNEEGIRFSGFDGGKEFIIQFKGDNPYYGDAWWGDFHQDVELKLVD